MDLKDYFTSLRRNWMLIVAFSLIGLLGGAIASFAVKPTYVADTQLFVAIQNSGSAQELQLGNTFTQARVQSYVKTISTPIVLQPAIDELGLDKSTDELSKQVTVSTDLNTVIIKIAVADSSPVQAAAIAQALGNSLVSAVEELERPKAGGTSPVNLSIIAPADAPSVPSSPNTKLNLLLGLLIGLGIGCGSALLRGVFDTRIRGEADLRRFTDVPLLGGIAYDSKAAKEPLLTDAGSQSPRAESFRSLRTNLSFANVSVRAKSVVVTSSLPGEGKSTTATNLAIALAQTGQRVCLVDADLRRPMVNEYLGLDRSAGLTTALVGAAPLEDLLQKWGDDDLYVLTSGVIPPNPSELLGSAEMRRTVEFLEEAFDTVVIDAPPLLPVTDAAVLSQHVGGVVLVVGVQTIRQPLLLKSLEALELVNANLLGVVLNRLPMKGPDAYSYGYYSYGGESSSEMEESLALGKRVVPGAQMDISDLSQGKATGVGAGVNSDDYLSEDIQRVGTRRGASHFPSRRVNRS